MTLDMSRSNRSAFGSATEGKVAATGSVSAAVVMGKPALAAYDILAGEIGHGLNAGRIDVPGVAIAMHAVDAKVVTPGGGALIDGTKHYDVFYNPSPDNDQLFGRSHEPKPMLPS